MRKEETEWPFRSCHLIRLTLFELLRCSEITREAQRGGAAGRKAHSAAEAPGHQDGQGEGGAEEEDEEQVRSQV